ncbi:MAG TPA: DUF1918 domain-containing protein [Actinomycetota bacterium]|nr:DUF1918 domain-containing protein [Actinomycetota bacterium]
MGDLLRIRGHHIGEADRDAETSKCAQSGGGPPYLVRWDGQVGLMFPESDAEIVFVARERKET